MNKAQLEKGWNVWIIRKNEKTGRYELIVSKTGRVIESFDNYRDCDNLLCELLTAYKLGIDCVKQAVNKMGWKMFIAKQNKTTKEFDVINSERGTVIDTFKTQLEAASLANLLEQAYEIGKVEIQFGKNSLNWTREYTMGMEMQLTKYNLFKFLTEPLGSTLNMLPLMVIPAIYLL